MRQTSKPEFLLNVLLTAVSILVALGVIEIALRLSGYEHQTRYVFDPIVGWVLRPGARARIWSEAEIVNSAGMRDAEHPVSKPPHTFRIEIYGDSFTEALQGPANRSFWSVAGRDLASCPALTGEKVEMLNFGVTGYGPGQELLLAERGWKYSPDVVVLAFFVGNDVDDTRPDNWVLMPHYQPVGNQVTLSPPDPRSKVARHLRWQGELALVTDHSRLLQFLEQTAIQVQHWPAANRTPHPSRATDNVLPAFVWSSKPTADSNWQTAWHSTELLIMQFNAAALRHRARFVLFLIPADIQVYPDVSLRSGFAREHNIDDLLYVNHRMEHLANGNGIPVLNLVDTEQVHADRTKVFLHGENGVIGFGHWNLTGHAFAGHVLASYLCAMLGAGQNSAIKQ